MLPLLQFSFTDDKSLPLLGVAVLALVYIVMRPMFKRKDPLDRDPPFKSLAQQRNVERQMHSLLVDLSEMARQISAQLDTRAAKLDALIREADEKIAQLREGIAPESSNPRSDSRQPQPAPQSQPSRPVRIRPSLQSGENLFPPVDQELFPPPASHADVAPRSPSQLTETRDDSARHADVYALADAGHSAQEIAAKLDRPNGEIELILALRAPRHIS